MALQTSGSITMADITTEFKVPKNTPMSKLYRNGGIVTSNNTKVPTSGPIKMSDFYGATSVYIITHIISTDTLLFNLNDVVNSSGWDRSAPLRVDITINPGIVVYSGDTSKPAAQIDYISGINGVEVNLLNNGYIVGMGGKGGQSWAYNNFSSGFPGGNALNVYMDMNLTNNGTIAGGGGGGNGVSKARPPSMKGSFAAGGGGQSGRINSPKGASNHTDTMPSEGTFDAPGNGGRHTANGYTVYGGAGGAWGKNGETADTNGTKTYGGTAGAAILSSKSNINIIAQGTILGKIINET